MFAARLRLLFTLGLLACALIPVKAADDPAKDPPRPSEAKPAGAKGIDGDNVPDSWVPEQALVRVEGRKLIIRQRSTYYETTEKIENGKRVATTVQKSVVRVNTHNTDGIVVLDMKGNQLAAKTWQETFKKDVHVLLSLDGRYPTAREMRLFNPDTLLVVLPAFVPPPPSEPKPPPPEPKPLPKLYNLPAPNPKPLLPLELPENIRGIVLKDIDVKNNVVEISIGADVGLKKEMQLDIYRETGGGKYLGTLTVTKVEPKTAVGEFKPARDMPLDKLRPEELPRKGDTVGILKIRD